MILAYQGTSIISRLIKWFSWGKYSHVSWSFCNYRSGLIEGDISEYEAWYKGGVRHGQIIGNNHTRGTRIDLYELKQPLLPHEVLAGKDFLMEQVLAKKKYDWTGIMGFVLRGRTNSQNRWFCSELVFAFLERVGRRLLNGVEAYQVSPSMLVTSPELTYIGYIIAGEDFRVRKNGLTVLSNVAPLPRVWQEIPQEGL